MTEMRGAATERAENLGHTLLEMTVVVMLMALLLGLTLPVLGSWTSGAQDWTTEEEMKEVSKGLRSFRADTGVFPTSLEELMRNDAALPNWQGPYLQGTREARTGDQLGYLQDGWGTPYVFEPDALGFSGTLRSHGPDRILDPNSSGDDMFVNVYLHDLATLETAREVKALNLAIARYNKTFLAYSGPLPSVFSDLLDELDEKGFLPDSASVFATDGWGQSYVVTPTLAFRVESLGPP